MSTTDSWSPTCAHGVRYDQACPLCNRNIPVFTASYPDPTAEMLRLLRQIADDVAEIKRTMPR